MKLPLIAASLSLLCACAGVESKYQGWGTYPISAEPARSTSNDSASKGPASNDTANDTASNESAGSDVASDQNSSNNGVPTEAEAHAALYPPPPQGIHGVDGPPRARPDMDWQKGEVLLQGFFGWTDFSKVSVDDGLGDTVDGDRGDVDSFPLIGGGAQYKLGGDKIDFGFEGLFSFGGRANAAAVAVGGGGAVVAVDVDMFVFEMYGGPFISIPLGQKMRVYGAVGPLLQWADYDQHGNNLHSSGSGFGTGWYARTGFEFDVGSHTYLGFGARWSDSRIDLSGTPQNIDIEGIEYMITVSRGI